MKPDSVDRRTFLRSAVAIGGASALAACIDREEPPASGSDGVDSGTVVRGGGGDRQFGWNDHLERDERGIPVPPRHHVLVFLEYTEAVPPEEGVRGEVDVAFDTLDRAFEWSDDGLLFTVGYSPYYFDRFDEDLHDSVDLQEPRPLTGFEDPEIDRYDGLVHLASDSARAVLAAEQALSGGVDEVNGVEVEADLTSAFEVADRRTGFIGEGLPAENQDVDGIPDDEPVEEGAPLYMGFHSQNLHEEDVEKPKEEVKSANQASEDSVAIEEGPFAEGTTQHVSQLKLDLHDWYGELSHGIRVQRMFSGPTDPEFIGRFGEDAVDDGVEDFHRHAENSARSYDVLGHAEKTARARDEDNDPVILRRDFDSTDGGRAGVHFVALQEKVQDFVTTRSMMAGGDLTGLSEEVGDVENNGILEFIEVERRGNYLVPPVDSRSLPLPNDG